MKQVLQGRRILQNWDAGVAALALCGMVLIPVIEVFVFQVFCYLQKLVNRSITFFEFLL